ncbi:MAG: UDP-3-O-(3-hydroxymyristoyl)glucosamine N-acyltransferase [Pseudomonadota bacterium]|nr:UDP-3-O-(3-hydroxymyristoyl)glucosamine N-acyltransferase [Pseudomonadota bacterium]
MQFSLRQLCDQVEGTIDGDPDLLIGGVNALEAAAEGEITFADQARYHDKAAASRAAAVVVGHDFPPLAGKSLLRVRRPRVAFIHIVRLFHPEPLRPPGVHASAAVAENVSLGEGVAIGECAVVRTGARIGPGTVIDAGVLVGRDAVIGRDCRIGPHVTLMHGVQIGDRVRIHAGSVIGGDGFGYVWSGQQHLKVPQIGTVRIDDDVEIGCNVCIDRATFGTTHIRRGVKIDNLVQIGHNNDIGEHTVIVSQVGLSGSVTVGKGVILAGQVGTTDHISIGDGAVVGGATAVTKDIAPGEKVWGYPSRPMAQVLRELASLTRLPKLIQQVRELAARLAGLEARLERLDRRE